MFRKTQWIALAALIAMSPALPAQTPKDTEPDEAKTTETGGPARFWQATVPGGNIMIALDRIVSISRAKYLLDGGVIVDEVTVDTVGQALARFYFIAPATDTAPGNAVSGLANRGRELLDHAAERVGTDAQNMVVKKYPDTTHAKSIEFRLLSEEDLTALYTSVKNSWESGRGRHFKTK